MSMGGGCWHQSNLPTYDTAAPHDLVGFESAGIYLNHGHQKWWYCTLTAINKPHSPSQALSAPSAFRVHIPALALPRRLRREMWRKDPGGHSGRRRGREGRKVTSSHRSERERRAPKRLRLYLTDSGIRALIYDHHLYQFRTTPPLSNRRGHIFILFPPTNLPGRFRSRGSMHPPDSGCMIKRLCSKR